MAERKKITLTFTKKNEDVYDILKDQPCTIEYICKVVREANRHTMPAYAVQILQELSDIKRQMKSGTFQYQEEEKDIWGIDADMEDMILNEED